MADNEVIIEQLRKDNEDLRRQLGDMGAQLERLTTLLVERANITASTSVGPPPEPQQTPQGQYDPYGVPQPELHQYAPQPTVMPQYVPPVLQENQQAPAYPNHHDPVPSDNLPTEEKLETILNRLNNLEGARRTVDPLLYCIVSDLEVPRDFNVPNFTKYDGTSDPESHISMYCSKMGAYHRNEKMLIYYF
jgi:hypothetical protein